MKTLLQCPKCENLADEAHAICPACGVVYEKFINPSASVARIRQQASKHSEDGPESAPPASAGNSSGETQRKTTAASSLTVLVFIAVIVTGMVKNSARDVVENAENGAVVQVQTFLRHHLKDPDSYQPIDWGKVLKRADGSYYVWHTYRAKNSFGGYVVSRDEFVIDSAGHVRLEQDRPPPVSAVTEAKQPSQARLPRHTIQEVVPVEETEEVSFWKCPGGVFTERPQDPTCLNMKTKLTLAQHAEMAAKKK